MDAFERWSASRGTLPAGAEAVQVWRDRIGIMLQGREDYLGRPDPTLWRSGDLHRLLIDHLPPRQVDAWGLAEHGVRIVREFLEFLDTSGRLHPGSTRVATLRKELDRAAGRFGAAMADSSQYRLAKRVLTAMLADGLGDDADPAEVDRWAERFSARDAPARRRVLGELMDQDPRYATGHLLVHGGQVAVLKPGVPPDKGLVWPDTVECDCGCADATVPEARLPGEAELAAAVAGSELLCRLSALAGWVGAGGRPVDRRGELPGKDVTAAAAAAGVPDLGARRLRDAPALATLWDLALELDVLSLCRARVIPGDTLPTVHAALRHECPPGQALEFWDEVFDELVHPQGDTVTPEQERLRDWARPWLPRFLGTLYTDHPDEELVEVGVLMDAVATERAEAVPARDSTMLTALAGSLVLRGLSLLAEHGAVEVEVSAGGPAPGLAPAARAVGMAPWAVSPPDGLRVRLTALGRRGVHKRLAGDGAGTPPMAHAASA